MNDLMEVLPKQNLRVMIIASGDLWAGAESVIYELCSGLKDYTPIQLTAVFLNEDVLARRCREAGVLTYVINEKRLNFLTLIRQAGGLIRRTRPHIIHAQRYKENILAFLAKGFFHLPSLVSTVHGRSEQHGGLKMKFLNLLNALILRHAFSAVVAVSQDLADYLTQHFRIPKLRIQCVMNGISLRHSARTDILAGEVITIGSAGRLFPVKDYPLMIDIAREMRNRRYNVKFVLAGRGPEMQRLRNKIAGCQLEEGFQLLGHVENIESFYRSIDVYINTSKHEGMPMTILEAMSYGIPVVGPAIPGLREVVISGVNGILVEERSSSSFAGALIRLMENRPAAIRMADKARQKIEREFSALKMVQDYFNLYRSLS